VRCIPSCVAKSTRAIDGHSSTFVRQTNTARFVFSHATSFPCSSLMCSFLEHRRPFKCIATPTSKLQLPSLTHCYAKRGGWTLSSKRRTPLDSMGTGPLHCLPQAVATAVRIHSVRTARRPSHRSSILYHVRERSRATGVTLMVGRRCRSLTDTSTRTDSGHSLSFHSFMSFTFLRFLPLSSGLLLRVIRYDCEGLVRLHCFCPV
jgi:hypothetical protein